MAKSTASSSLGAFCWQQLSGYRLWFLLMLSAPVVASFYPFFYNYAIKLFIDAFTRTAPLSAQSLVLPLSLFIGARLMLEFFWRFSAVIEWHVLPNVRKKLTLAIYHLVQSQPFTFFHTYLAGEVTSKVKSILEGFDRIWIEIQQGAFNRFLKVFVNTLALTLVNGYLALIVSVWVLFYVPVMTYLSTKLHQQAKKEARVRHGILGKIGDNISNIYTIFSFATGNQELKALNNKLEGELIPTEVKLYQIDFGVQLFSGLMYLFIFIFTVFYLLHLKITQQITVGDFVLVFGLMLTISENLWNMTTRLQDFARTLSGMATALEQLTPLKPQFGKILSPAAFRSPEIVFQGVSFGYEKASTLKNINLTIKPGEKIGLVGPTGSGKSTLLHLLQGHYVPSRGQIFINEHDIQRLEINFLRQQIAVIPQETQLFHRSIWENITYGNPKASEEEVITASQKAHVHDYIMSLPNEYATLVGERGAKLSGGQRQRLVIARAILKNAPILLLDEATSALDSHTEQLIQDSLHALFQETNKTVIVVAHRLSTLKDMDRVIVLNEGTIVEEGTHEELLKTYQGLYQKMWQIQQK